jgi:glycerate kinase
MHGAAEPRRGVAIFDWRRADQVVTIVAGELDAWDVAEDCDVVVRGEGCADIDLYAE